LQLPQQCGVLTGSVRMSPSERWSPPPQQQIPEDPAPDCRQRQSVTHPRLGLSLRNRHQRDAEQSHSEIRQQPQRQEH